MLDDKKKAERRSRSWRTSRRTRHVFWIVLQLWMVGFTIIVVSMYLSNKSLAREGQAAHDALCIGRAALQRDVTRREQYIEDVVTKQREPVPGVTLGEVQFAIDDDKDTIRRLEILNCPDEEPAK